MRDPAWAITAFHFPMTISWNVRGVRVRTPIIPLWNSRGIVSAAERIAVSVTKSIWSRTKS